VASRPGRSASRRRVEGVVNMLRDRLASTFSRFLAAVGPKNRRSEIDILSARLRKLFPEIRPDAPDLSSALARAGVNGEKPHLARTIFGSDLAAAARLSADAMLVVLHCKVVRDFESDRLIVVDGWHLSRTEACVLAMIAEPQVR